MARYANTSSSFAAFRPCAHHAPFLAEVGPPAGAPGSYPGAEPRRGGSDRLRGGLAVHTAHHGSRRHHAPGRRDPARYPEPARRRLSRPVLPQVTRASSPSVGIHSLTEGLRSGAESIETNHPPSRSTRQVKISGALYMHGAPIFE